MIGIIGGYGLEKILKNPREEKHEARFDDEKISGDFPVFQSFKGKVAGKDVMVIPRHGVNHDLPPHRVPYKSMIRLLKDRGVRKLITVNSVGVMNARIKRGSFILVKDFVNFGKDLTFFDSFREGPRHTNMSEPYSREINEALKKALRKAGVKFHTDAVYVNSHGPRFETPSEIEKKYAPCGDLVGMTGAYEAILANELAIPLGTVCLGMNYAEGRGVKVGFEDIKRAAAAMQEKLFIIIKEAVRLL